MVRRPQVRAALAELEAIEAFDEIADPSDWPAVQALAATNYKRLAMIAHPDRGGSTDRMAALNAAYTLVKNLQPPVRARRRTDEYAEVVNIMQEAMNGFVGTAINLDDFIRVTVIRR